MLFLYLFIYSFAVVFASVLVVCEIEHFAPLCRLCELRQPGLVAGGHPVYERLSDRDEAAEGAAQALQERQQALLRALWRRRPEARCRKGGVTVSGWSAAERPTHRVDSSAGSSFCAIAGSRRPQRLPWSLEVSPVQARTHTHTHMRGHKH